MFVLQWHIWLFCGRGRRVCCANCKSWAHQQCAGMMMRRRKRFLFVIYHEDVQRLMRRRRKFFVCLFINKLGSWTMWRDMMMTRSYLSAIYANRFFSSSSVCGWDGPLGVHLTPSFWFWSIKNSDLVKSRASLFSFIRVWTSKVTPQSITTNPQNPQNYINVVSRLNTLSGTS